MPASSHDLAMENIPQLGTWQDLEQRAARVADPGVGSF